MTDLLISVPPCFHTKLFIIHQDFLNAYQTFEEQFAILPENNRENSNLDAYREIIDDALKALACISNTFNPQSSSGESYIKTNVKNAEDALKKATLNCYKYSLAAIKVDIDLVYKNAQTEPCLKDMPYDAFRISYEDFKSLWYQARSLERQADDSLQAYLTATTAGARLRSAIDFSILDDILNEQDQEPDRSITIGNQIFGQQIIDNHQEINKSQVSRGDIKVEDSQIGDANVFTTVKTFQKDHPSLFIAIAIFLLTATSTAFLNWFLPKIFQATLNNTTTSIIQNMTAHTP